MNRPNCKSIAINDARLITEAGLAKSAISLLIQENQTRSTYVNGGEFLGGYTRSGLMMALDLLADQLTIRGAEVLDLLETERV